MQEGRQSSIAAVLEAAECYYRAMVGGEEAVLRRLFDARAALMGHFEGEFQWLDLESFIDETKSLVGQHGEEACVVESVRVDGSIATVVVRGRYADLWFVDHLSLVAVDDGWRITGKAFHVVE